MTNIKYEKVSQKYKNEDRISSSWWNCDPKDMPNSIQATINSIDESQSARNIAYEKYSRLYSNMELRGFLNGKVGTDSSLSNRITYNIVKSAIDTAQSKIAKSKPKVQFLTEDGDFGLKQRSQNLTKYVEGVFYDTELYSKAQKAFIHGCVFGTGALKIFSEDGEIQVENVFIQELKVDDADGIYGKPRQMHQVKTVSREVLLANHPDHADAILSAKTEDIFRQGTQYVSDRVKVTESWHLPSSKDSKDGKRVISIENTVLHHEEYNKDYFPFVFWRWSDKLAGFFGQGVAEELIGVQIEINKILRNIQKAQHLVAVPRVAVEQGTKVSNSMISNEIASIFKYAGKAPTFFTPTAMNAEVYNHLKWLIQSGFEAVGITQLSATGKKPSGLDAAVALREYQDIETERFMITAQNYEAMFMEAAEIIIDQSRDLFEDGVKLKTKVKTSKFIETIDWKDVNLEDSQYVMKMFPVSLLPNTPAGRLQKTQELVEAGFIDKDQALSLLDFPDLESAQNLQMASLKLTERQIYEITHKGKYSSPEPYQNLQLAIKLAHQAFLKGKLDNLPEERLELLLRYLDDAERLVGQSQPQEPAQPTEPAPEMNQVDTAPIETM